MQNKKVFSGIRATGRLHLGNYYGAIKGMLELQETHECIFGIMDLHTITVPYAPRELQPAIHEVVLDYLAAGIDPQKAKLIIQSRVPEVIELSYYLATIYQLARIEDLPTYKEKKAQYPDYVNVGLLYYPILMAADVLLYKASLVPVGIDQEPHLEVMREVARKFNRMYGDTFPEPQRYATTGEYVPSLTGEGKMSKSREGSFIILTDTLEEIEARLAKAPTDSGRIGGPVPQEGPVANLFMLLKLFSTEDTIKHFRQTYEAGTIKYVELKQRLARDIYQELGPLQERRRYFAGHPDEVRALLTASTEAARATARETLVEVRHKMGLFPLVHPGAI